jgi:hypothetical protein
MASQDAACVWFSLVAFLHAPALPPLIVCFSLCSQLTPCYDASTCAISDVRRSG